MQNIKKYFMTLALLLTAVTGAWAQSTFGVKEITADMLPASWSTDESAVTAADLPGFKASTSDEVNAWGAPAEGYAVLFYAFDGEKASYVLFNEGSPKSNTTTPYQKNLVFNNSKYEKFYYTTEITEWELTSKDGKNWILDKMPANNIELQVEYFAESNLFLGKEALADKANISVLNGSTAVEFDAEGKSTATVTEGNTVTVTYTGTKKVLGVKAEKRVSYPIAISAVTSDYIGSVVTTDGNVYATVAAATAASKTPVAMIAYVGTASDCAHGLAIALEDVSNEKLTWNNSGNNNESKTAAEWCSAWNTSKAVTGGTWRLPSISDWQYMFIGCGASESYSDNPIQMSYSGLASKLTTAQGDALPVNADYWSSTEASTEYLWTVRFGESYAFFYNNTWEGHAFDLVRACLAF